MVHRAFRAPVAESFPEGTKTVCLVPDGALHAAPREAIAPPGPTVTGERPTLASRVPGLRKFAPLPGTAREVALVAEAFERARRNQPRDILRRDECSEAAVREKARGKAVLHLATHGFIRDDLDGRLRPPAGELFRLRGGLEAHARRFDPLLMTGLALAGANQRIRENQTDGILTSLEVLDCDLMGTDLVFLSACETARGIEQSGEGVLGLVSAFSLVGAKNVAASLWPVSDDATVELVDKFYESWLDKRGADPARALLEASRELRRHPDYRAPRHWAAFVVYGPLR